MPLYLQQIPLGLYGAWLASGNILFWLTAVDLGLTNVVMQRVGTAYGRRDLEEVGGYLSSGLLISLGIALFILLLGIVLSINLITLLDLPVGPTNHELQNAFLIAAIGTCCNFLGFSIGGMNNGLQGSFGVGIIAVLAQVASITMVVVSLVNGWGLLALASGVLIRGAFLIAGNLGYLFWRKRVDDIPLSINREYFQDLTKMLGFTSLGTLGFALSERMDAFWLTRILGPEATPILVLSKRGPGVAEMVLGRPGNAFAPSIAHLAGEGDWEKARVVLCRLIRIIVWGTGISVAGFLALNEAFVSLWVGSEFYAGTPVNLAIVAVLLIGLPLRNMAVLCTAMGDIKGIAIMGLCRGLVTFVFMIVGIIFLGILGAALAPLLSFLFVVMFYVPRSFGRLIQLGSSELKSHMLEFIRVMLIGCGLGLCLPLFHETSWISFALNVLLLSTAYLVLLLTFSKYFRSETGKLLFVARTPLKQVGGNCHGAIAKK